MGHTVLLCCLLTAATPAPADSTSTSEALRDYAAEAAKVGPDGPSQLKLALWCEAHGLTAERAKHLALAVLKDPNNASARGLLGLMTYRGKWETPETVSARIKADEALTAKLAEYNARRDELKKKEDALRPANAPAKPYNLMAGYRQKRLAAVKLAPEHVKLGMWCETHGLKAEAQAHFTQAVVLDPYREAAWKHLGYVKHNGRWLSREQVAADRKEETAQRRADRYWEPLLKKWRELLRDDKTREQGETELASVTDPRAVPSVTKVFAEGGEPDQQRAVQILGQVEGAAASRALARLAVFSTSHAVRTAAIETLRQRVSGDYAGLLVQAVRSPMSYRVEPVGGPGAPGAMLVETPRFRMLRTYDAPAVWQPSATFHGVWAGVDPNGLPVVIEGRLLNSLAPALAATPLGTGVVADSRLRALEERTARMIASANLKAAASQQMLISDVQAIDEENAITASVNERVTAVLHGALDAPSELKDDENAWNRWWFDKVGYKYDPPPQVEVLVNASPQYPPPVISSCFVAGTIVRTLDGRKPIETLRVGDQVLTLDTATGALSFQSVVVVHHNPPAETLKVALDNGETLTASIYHRFWRVGKGWAMARELKAGEVVRTLAGPSRVKAVEPGPFAPLFNLDVDRTRTFFVGDKDVLVHDNRLPDPRETPFDSPTAIAASPSGGRGDRPER
jgi:hypothetical protein